MTHTPTPSAACPGAVSPSGSSLLPVPDGVNFLTLHTSPVQGTSRPPQPDNSGVTGGRIFSFIGTAADHLRIAEKAIEDARRSHSPVRELLRRRVKLKARVAALGAS